MEFLGFADPVYSKDMPINTNEKSFENIRSFSTRKGLEFNRLPFSNEEVKKIAIYFPEKLQKTFMRETAREENFKACDLSNYKIIHLAMHGFFDEKNPSRSSLVFGIDNKMKDDGLLQVREIYNLKLNADLVVLSACNTGRGKLEKGEGVSGLYRAFLNAGAKSVIMSLWTINDKATAEFMGYFYKNLIAGYSKVKALYRTKIKMLNTRYNHPYYWAAFVLNGESKSAIK